MNKSDNPKNRFRLNPVYAALLVASTMATASCTQTGGVIDSAKATASKTASKLSTANPCNPCAAANPCNPCAAANPCNPCAAANPCNPCAAANPCNPCAAANPCNPCAAANPCNPCAAANPCNPCAAGASSKSSQPWADYKDWHKLTKNRVTTGDPTGTLGNVHRGRDGYRDVYVNDIGKAALTGTAPYNFPAGTIVVKEQYGSKADWQAQKNAAHTISVKIKDGPISAANWSWSAGYDSPARNDFAFCSGCHTAAIKSDFVFTTEDFLSSH